jgi:chromatin structure-remodeling complex subunit RSC9
MNRLFEVRPDGELTQTDFWNLYRDAFEPYAATFPLMIAAQVVQAVATVFPQTHSIVLPGPVPRYVVRGVDRRRETRARCRWARNACPARLAGGQAELAQHVYEHVTAAGDAGSCEWAGCTRGTLPRTALWAHVATHLRGALPSDGIAIGGADLATPSTDAAARAPRTVTQARAAANAPPAALTALLCLRGLFHCAFAASGAAPRADADHFGFPGVVEEDDDAMAAPTETDEEGERRGRRAFAGVRHLLERVLMKDDVLMGWIVETVQMATYAAL